MIQIDMEMPKNCNYCILRDIDYSCHADGMGRMTPRRWTEAFKTRPEWCPLHEPEWKEEFF